MTRDTAPRCGTCDTPTVITYDALKRPRYRCPECQGVGPVHDIELHGPLHRQSAMSSADLAWPAPTDPDPMADRAAPGVRTHAEPTPGGVRRCVLCREPLPTGMRGRPRKYCADKRACAARGLQLLEARAPGAERVA